MNIDWFTFAAQIVNFLILVALLRWLLYGRIVRAMKSREEKIAEQFREADRKRMEAEQEVEEYEEKARQLDQQREKLLQEARRKAGQEQKRLLHEAREEVDRQRDQWRETFHRERDDVLAEVRRQASRMGLITARRTLSQLAGAELETRMCETLAEQLQDIDDQQREEIKQHLADGDAEVWIRSAFDLADPQRKRLRDIIRKTFGYDEKVAFENSSALVCGLELDLGGYSIGWNVNDLLSDLQTQLEERLQSISRTASASEKQPADA
jgi:F-type H+-transporting ATPase subunit b